LFGHCFVPFGKLECFGSGPLASLTARTVQPPGPGRVNGSAPRQAVPRGGPPRRGLDTAGWRLQCEKVSKAIPWFVSSRTQEVEGVVGGYCFMGISS
jgi:hypothetical protein